MDNITHSISIKSPVGTLSLYGEDDTLVGIYYSGTLQKKVPVKLPKVLGKSSPVLKETVAQLKSYFAGNLKEFDLPLSAKGTAFQQQVWHQLTQIPYGQTISYGELAHRIQNPKACRAVGSANGKNPISIVIPCHRVINNGGRLGGYGGGLNRKSFLLGLEDR